MIAVILCSFISVRSNDQVVEKLELVLAPPTYNTDRHDGLYYEARGGVYEKGTVFNCGLEPDIKRLGTYRIGVSYGTSREHIATYQITIGERPNVRILVWQGYFKFDPNEDGSEYAWAYSGYQAHTEISILTDFTLLSKSCFGGRLIIYFLNGG